jgi:hypothetical protein
MKDNINLDIKNITGEIKDLLKLIDNLEVEIIDTNKKNEHKIIMYKMMMENIILEYHETCKKLFIK